MDILSIILGPIGGAVAGILALLGLWVLGKRKGASDARTERERKDNEAYRAERARQDGLDVGIGADDDERRRRLRDIADRRGPSND